MCEIFSRSFSNAKGSPLLSLGAPSSPATTRNISQHRPRVDPKKTHKKMLAGASQGDDLFRRIAYAGDIIPVDRIGICYLKGYALQDSDDRT